MVADGPTPGLITVRIPAPIPVNGVIAAEPIVMGDIALVRIQYSSAALGCVFIHIPAENAEALGRAIAEAGKAALAPHLTIAQTLPPNGELRPPGV